MRRVLLLLTVIFSCIQIQAQTLPFAEGEIDIIDPYVGQPIIYTLRIYTTDIVENSTIVEPSFFGFGRSSIVIEPNTYTETIDSIGYNVIEQSYVIYPLRAGELIIDPFRIEIPQTPFSASQTILNDAITVNVQAYPEPMPESFVNAVGQFDISASADPTTLSSGDALTLSVVVSGTGNFEQMLAPTFDLPENWRLFNGQTDYVQDNLRFGSKTFEWTVIVEGEGTADIPEVVFSYLNPQSGEYETLNTSAIALNIVPSSPQPEITIERTLIVLTDVPIPELLPIRSNEILPPAPPIWFWLIWLIPPLLTFFIWLFARPKQARQPRQLIAQKPQRKSGNRALQDLRQSLLQAQSVEPKEAYQTITESIYAYLSTKSGEVVLKNDVSDIIKGFPANYRDELLSCLDEANAGQYAPVTTKDVRALSQRVLRVCVAIEKVS